MLIKTVNLLDDRREYRGFWWHPDDCSDKIAGTLTYTREHGLMLELMGILTRVAPGKELPDRYVLHGSLIEGNDVTLDKVRMGYTPRAPGIFTQTFRASYAFFGDHISDVSEYLFPSCCFRLTFLEEWLSYQPIDAKPHVGSSSGVDASIRTVYGGFERVDHIDASIRQVSSFSTFDERPRRYDLYSHAWLVLRPTTPRQLDWYLTCVSRIRNLVKLCVYRSIYIEEFHIYNIRDENLIFVYEQVPTARVTDRNLVRPPLRSSQLGDNLGSTISRWMALYDEAHHSLQVFFVGLLESTQYMEERFLLLAKAIEVYHRRKGSFLFVDKEEYERELRKLEGILPDSFPPALRRRICSTLKTLNEYPFGRRLEDLDETLAKLDLVRLPNKSRRKIVATRNYLTHYSEELRDQVKYGEQMHELIEHMIAVMTVLVLNEIGVSRDAIRHSLEHPNLRRFLTAGT